MKYQSFTASLLCGLLAISNSTAQAKTVFVDTTVDLEIDPEDPDYAIIKVQMKQGTWFGIGFGKGMVKDNDMIMISGGAKPSATDMTSNGKGKPVTDAVQKLEDVKFTSGAGDLLNVEMRRKLDTGVASDYVIQTDVDFDLAWAVHQTKSDITSYHGNTRGDTTYRIAAPVPVVKPKDEDVADNKDKDVADDKDEDVAGDKDEDVAGDKDEDVTGDKDKVADDDKDEDVEPKDTTEETKEAADADTNADDGAKILASSYSLAAAMVTAGILTLNF